MTATLGYAANIAGVAGFTEIVEKLGKLTLYCKDAKNLDEDLTAIKESVDRFRMPWEALESRLKRPEYNNELLESSRLLSSSLPQVTSYLKQLEDAISRPMEDTSDHLRRVPLWHFEKEKLTGILDNLQFWTSMAILTLNLDHEWVSALLVCMYTLC